MNYKNSIRCTFIVIISLVINNIFIDNCESSTQTKNVLLEKVKSAYTNKDVELLYKVTYFSGNDDVAVKKRIGNDFSKHILFPIKSIEIVPLNSELLRHLKNMRMMKIIIYVIHQVKF